MIYNRSRFIVYGIYSIYTSKIGHNHAKTLITRYVLLYGIHIPMTANTNLKFSAS